MKSFLLKILFFFSVVAIVDFSFGKGCDYMTDHAKGGATKQLIDLCKKDQYDVLIMGSSKAHHNYKPQAFMDSLGMSCYNAGYDGNGIILAYGILSMIDDDRLPKLIIYDVKQQFDFSLYSGDGDYTRYYKKLKTFYREPVVNEIIRSISRKDLFKMHSGLFRYNGELLHVSSGFLRGSVFDYNYGYEPLIGMLTDDAPQEKDYSNQIDSLKCSYFRKFIELTKIKKIETVVVFSPEYNSPFSDDFKFIRELCESYGVKVIDHFDSSSFHNKQLFYDHCHLNKQGAEMFTDIIINDIKQLKKNERH